MRLLDIFRKKEKTSVTEENKDCISKNNKRDKAIDTYCSIYDSYYSLVEVVKFEEFGFWIESVSTIKKIFLLMQPLVNTLTANGYKIIEIGASGGVHELDTGYECFSDKKYTSFEEAQENLPLDFAKEQDTKLDGSWLNTLNFETFSIKLIKGNACYGVLFSRGELCASAAIVALIPVDEMKAILVNNK